MVETCALYCVQTLCPGKRNKSSTSALLSRISTEDVYQVTSKAQRLELKHPGRPAYASEVIALNIQLLHEEHLPKVAQDDK